MLNKVISIPLYDENITPNQFKTLISLLNKQKTDVDKDYQARMAALDTERCEFIKNINTSIDVLSDIFLQDYQVCIECRGTGTIQDYDNMYDERGHSVKCKTCNGAGYLKKGE